MSLFATTAPLSPMSPFTVAPDAPRKNGGGARRLESSPGDNISNVVKGNLFDGYSPSPVKTGSRSGAPQLDDLLDGTVPLQSAFSQALSSADEAMPQAPVVAPQQARNEVETKMQAAAAPHGTRRPAAAMESPSKRAKVSAAGAYVIPEAELTEVSIRIAQITFNGKTYPLQRVGSGVNRKVYIFLDPQTITLNNKEYDVRQLVFKTECQGYNGNKAGKKFIDAQAAFEQYKKLGIPVAELRACSHLKRKGAAPSGMQFFEGTCTKVEEEYYKLQTGKGLENWTIEERQQTVDVGDLVVYESIEDFNELPPKSIAAQTLQFIKKHVTVTGTLTSDGRFGNELINDLYTDNLGYSRNEKGEVVIKSLDYDLVRPGDLIMNLYSYVIHASRGNRVIFDWLISDFSPAAKEEMFKRLKQDMSSNEVEKNRAGFPISLKRKGEGMEHQKYTAGAGAGSGSGSGSGSAGSAAS